MTIEEVLKTLDTSNAALRNNAGGYYNHNLYFDLMTPNSTGKPTGKLADAINRDFGSFENFKSSFLTQERNNLVLVGLGWLLMLQEN